jgi:hypothetical protein
LTDTFYLISPLSASDRENSAFDRKNRLAFLWFTQTSGKGLLARQSFPKALEMAAADVNMTQADEETAPAVLGMVPTDLKMA